MVKLFCVIVGGAGSSFPVDIDENETDVLTEMPNPQSRQIHVLVVVPGHVRVNIEKDTNGGPSTVNASYLPYW
ncbi:hypothetical protein PHMEG_00033413, partial [Phytophthora megakarya]